RKFRNVEEEQKDEQLDGAVEELLQDGNVGILIMHDNDLSYLSRQIRSEVETSVEPTVVTIGEGSQSGLREQIRRAIGIDLLAEEEGESE
ncbi:MAG: V-type ATP synthase subunit F, partial [Halobacteriaceae archaeon]